MSEVIIANPIPASRVSEPELPSKPASPKAAPPAAPRRRPPLWTLFLAAGFIAVAADVYIPSRYVVETDDAYVQADTISVVPKVAAPDPQPSRGQEWQPSVPKRDPASVRKYILPRARPWISRNGSCCASRAAPTL